MYKYETTADVGEDGKITIQLPADAPSGEVRVEVRQQDPQESPPNSVLILEMLEAFRKQRGPSKLTRLDVDRYLEEERNSWE